MKQIYETCDVAYRSCEYQIMQSTGWITWTVNGNLATMMRRTDGRSMYYTGHS